MFNANKCLNNNVRAFFLTTIAGLALASPSHASLQRDNVLANKPLEQTALVLRVKEGDSITALFKRAGLTTKQGLQLYRKLKSGDSKFMIHPNDRFLFTIGRSGELQSVVINRARYNDLVVDAGVDDFLVESRKSDVQTEITNMSGVLSEDFKKSLKVMGADDALIFELAEILKYDLDLTEDVEAGASIEIMLEKRELYGRVLGYGEIHSVVLKRKNGELLSEAYRVQVEAGVYRYFNSNGEPVAKAFTHAPLDLVRVSSRFNKMRHHPKLGIDRPHKGTDYAAPIGTPVKATADGIVKFVGRNGGYGKMIILDHKSDIVTKYGHLSGYASELSKGSFIQQGDVIGYVGDTGLVTGPHLHYEVLVDGMHVDPEKMRPKDYPVLPEFAKDELRAVVLASKSYNL